MTDLSKSWLHIIIPKQSQVFSKVSRTQGYLVKLKRLKWRAEGQYWWMMPLHSDYSAFCAHTCFGKVWAQRARRQEKPVATSLKREAILRRMCSRYLRQQVRSKHGKSLHVLVLVAEWIRTLSRAVLGTANIQTVTFSAHLSVIMTPHVNSFQLGQSYIVVSSHL